MVIASAAPAGDPSGAWWVRAEVRESIPPLAFDDPRLRRFLDAYDWRDE